MTAGGLVVLDGGAGEGGGQIVRSALCLSLVSGRPVRIENVRARRERPGLLRQHLTAVELATQVGGASVTGAELGSKELEFRPNGVFAGRFVRAIGTAGSTTLVAQTVLPALLLAEAPSELTLSGGTHNPSSPPFDFLARSYVPRLTAAGAGIDSELVRHGFYPAGGGEIRLRVRPSRLRALEIVERGDVSRITATALVAGLPEAIAERELKVVREKLGLVPADLRAEVVGGGPGNVLTVEVETTSGNEVFTGFGRRGVPAERVAANVVREVKNWLRADVPVGEHLADQLLLPLALGEGGVYRTVRPSMHTQTHARVIRSFLPDVVIDLDEEVGGAWRVRVAKR